MIRGDNDYWRVCWRKRTDATTERQRVKDNSGNMHILFGTTVIGNYGSLLMHKHS